MTVKRNSAATCWSNYKQYFATRDLGYTLMKFVMLWHIIFYTVISLWGLAGLYRGRIYNLSYEKLTVDQDNETRNLLEYLQLDWRRCLSHRNNQCENSIKTTGQRKGLSRQRTEAWLKYKPFLDCI